MENKKEILYDAKWFKVIKSTSDQGGTMTGLDFDNDNVVIVPYILVNNVPIKIGVNLEHNPLKRNNVITTAITGNIDENETHLEAAKRELLEESGYDVQDDNRWDYLGRLSMSKLSTSEHPCYVVDITDLQPIKRNTDGTKNEKLSEFKIIDVKELTDTNDGYLLSVIMKYFFKNFSNLF